MSRFLAAVVTLNALLISGSVLANTAAADVVEVDVCVYGGTSGGVIAAVEAARLGKRTVLIEPGKHLGGMSSSGNVRSLIRNFVRVSH